MACIHYVVQAQSLEPFNPYGVFSPSVEAWQMTRYGNLTPSLYTGAMTFSLPLYTYEDQDFTIPISLDYSFDGYRPGQHSGTVGYGWYLNCGGVITREVRGIPDEGDLDDNQNYNCLVRGWRQMPALVRDSQAYYSSKIYSAHRILLGYVPEDQCQGLLTSYNTFSDLPGIAPNASEAMGAAVVYDTAPDIYRFRFLGHSGSFMMLPDGSVEVFDSDLPHGELSVSFTDSSVNPANVDITITTGDGCTYLFSTAGVNCSPNLVSDMPFRVGKSVNEYCLMRITAPNGRKVQFSQTSLSTLGISRTYGPEGSVQYSIQTLHDHGDGGASSGTTDLQNPVPWTVFQGSSCTPSLIIVDGMENNTTAATISLSYTSTTNEFASGCFSQSTLATQYGTASSIRLSSISVCNGSGETVEYISLTHHSHPYGTPKLFLDSVTSLRGGTHSFAYNLNGYTLPDNDTQGTDHWGFWNGSSISDLRALLDSTSTHLFDQTIGSAKEAAFYYSTCGALTRISYPTGGTTDIEYEPNTVRRRLNRHRGNTAITLEPADSSNTNATWTVGGVRVKTLSDSDAAGTVRTTAFTYADSQGKASGILMQMPRYCETAQYIHRVNSFFADNGVAAVALATITAFSSDLFPLSSDTHVAYPDVTVTHPDGSYTRHAFTSVTDYADTRAQGSEAVKHTMCDHDSIEALDQGSVASYLVPVSGDRRAMRGKPLSETTFSASGTPMHSVSYTYSSYNTTIPTLLYNNTTCYNLCSYTAVSPLLLSKTEDTYGMAATQAFTYNAKGQTESVTTERFCNAAGPDLYLSMETERTYYRYLHEGYGDAWFAANAPLRSAKDAAVRTAVMADGTELVCAAEGYSYSSGNPRPASITRYSQDPPAALSIAGNRSAAFSAGLGGSSRVTTISYDTMQRPRLLSLPGSAHIAYTWNGTNLASRTDNGANNTTAFTWKSLVGPTGITSPSGYQASYDYDSRGRLHSEKDSMGNVLSVYNYKLFNE